MNRPRHRTQALTWTLLAGLAGGTTACLDAEPDSEPATTGAALERDPEPATCASGVGMARITNHTRTPIDVAIAESTGVISTLRIPPGRTDQWKVATGYTGMEATPVASRTPIFNNTYQVTCDGLITADIWQPDFKLPSSAIMTGPRGTVTDGTFDCDPGRATTSLTSAIVGGNRLEYRLTCNDPNASLTTRTLRLQVPWSFTTGAKLVEPVKGCLENFRAFRRSRTLRYFSARFSAHQLTCAADTTAVGTPHFDFPSVMPPAPAPGPSGDLTIARHHVQSDPDLHDDYNTYEPSTSLYSGITGNFVLFHYRNKDVPADGSVSYVLQLAGANEPTGSVADPCDGWDTPAELIVNNGVTLTQVGTAPFQGENQQFYQHLKGPTTFYARMVPMTNDAFGDPQCTLGPSNWVALDVVEDDPDADNYAALNAYVEAQKAKAAAEQALMAYSATPLSYFPPQLGKLTYSADRTYITTKPNPNNWPIGCRYEVPTNQGNKPWYAQAWDGVISAIEWVNEAYADMKNQVIGVAANSIPACEPCKGAIAAGMNDAMGHLRIPTAIPNLDSAIESATPYTAMWISRELDKQFGIGDYAPLFLQLGHSLASVVRFNLGGGSGLNPYDMYSWGRPDPFFQPRPAMVYVRVTRDSDPAKYKGAGFSVVDQNHIYKPVSVPMPELQPGESMDVPVFLEPDVKNLYNWSGLQSYNDASNFGSWYNNDYKVGAGWMDLRISSGLSTTNLNQPAGLPYGTYNMLQAAPPCP